MRVEVGQVLWHMRGIRQDDKIRWYAFPLCVEKLRDNSFHDAHGTGGSFGLIGKTYFLTRDDAINDFVSRNGSLEESVDINESQSEKQKEHISERPRTNWNDKVIYKYNCGVNECGVYTGGLTHLKDITDMLVWNVHENDEMAYMDEHLTLREIFEQVSSNKGRFTGYGNCLITVIQDDPMRSSVYQCNNYKRGQWVHLGNVMGYA